MNNSLQSQHHIAQKDFNHKVGRLLRKYRVSQGIAGTELGRKINISQQQISRYERGVCALTLYQAERYIQALGVPWSLFINDMMR